MADFTKPIPCFNCDNKKMETGYVQTGVDVIVQFHCPDCDYQIFIIQPSKRYDYQIERQLIQPEDSLKK